MKAIIKIISLSIFLISVHRISAQDDLLKAMNGLGDLDYYLLKNTNTDQSYHIIVKKPIGYSDTLIYPVLYLLDGGLTFPLLASYSTYLQFGDEISPHILVGISYGTERLEEGNTRGHDYTAPSLERKHYGGAEEFSCFLKEDVFVYIEERYACDVDKRIIFGQSLGGQYVIYAAQFEPTMFWGHIASNPALHRNLDFYTTGRELISSGRQRLFVSNGSENDERYMQPANKWIAYWQHAKHRPWKLKTVNLEGHTHFSAATESYRLGLEWLFSYE